MLHGGTTGPETKSNTGTGPTRLVLKVANAVSTEPGVPLMVKVNRYGI